MRASPVVIFPFLLAACAGPTAADDDLVSDDDSTEVGDDDATVDSALLHGDVPDLPIDLPEFAALNRDGGARDRDDLLGHPSVLWFYPAAFTGT